MNFGNSQDRYQRTYHRAPFTLEHCHETGRLLFFSTLSKGAGWCSIFDLSTAPAWRATGVWHHIACVWDATAPRADWLRMYIDGKKVSGLTRILHEEYISNRPQVELETTLPYCVQIGGRTRGRAPMNAELDEFRISRAPRYLADFAPPTRPFALDAHTSALLHFDRDLVGHGMTPQGQRYRIDATAGWAAYGE